MAVKTRVYTALPLAMPPIIPQPESFALGAKGPFIPASLANSGEPVWHPCLTDRPPALKVIPQLAGALSIAHQ